MNRTGVYRRLDDYRYPPSSYYRSNENPDRQDAYRTQSREYYDTRAGGARNDYDSRFQERYGGGGDGHVVETSASVSGGASVTTSPDEYGNEDR